MIMQRDLPLAGAAAVLPTELADRLRCLKEHELPMVEELRLRRGYPMTALLPAGECPLGGGAITERDLHSVLECATQASAHTVLEQVQKGFVTLKGGHRIGLCGTVNRKDGVVTSLRYLSSLSIRIARAVEGGTGKIVPKLLEGDKFLSTLIVGPPGSGKTTLLRELVRTLSDGRGVRAHRVGLVDERGEVAALWCGQPQFRVGCQTDVLDNCLKAEGMTVLLRGMNPQILAVDEITHVSDVEAAMEAVGCGVELLATAHGSSAADLQRRPIYRSLLERKVFQRAVVIRNDHGIRSMEVEVLE